MRLKAGIRYEDSNLTAALNLTVTVKRTMVEEEALVVIATTLASVSDSYEDRDTDLKDEVT